MMLKILCVALALGGALSADDDFKPEDALYAPEEMTGSAEAASPAASGSPSGSYYSTAHINVVDLAGDHARLQGVEIFINGNFVGKSPLELSGFLVDKPLVAISARLDDYHEALRAAVRLPAEGELRLSMVGDNAASWYTTPAWIGGLAMLAGAVAAYSQNTSGSSELGLGLVCTGVGVIAISQGVARLFHLPSLDRQVEAQNAKAEPLP